jgi:hypothetical protein
VIEYVGIIGEIRSICDEAKMSRFALAAVLSGALVILASSCKSTSDQGAPMPTVTQPIMQPTVTMSEASGLPKTSSTPTEASINSSGDPATLAEAAMSSEGEAIASPRIDWARLSRAKVTKLDWAGRVAMVDVGRLDGVHAGHKLYTLRNDQLTGLMIPVQAFERQSICVVGALPPGMSSGKVRVGDRVTVHPRGAFPKATIPDSVTKQMDIARGPIPGEAKLKSLQETITAILREKHLDPGPAVASTKEAMKAERKAIDNAWKTTVAQVKNYTSPVIR